MKLRAIQLGLPGLVSVVAAFACGGNPEVAGKNDIGDGGTSSSDGGTSSNTGGTVHVGDGGEDSGGSNGSGGTNNNGTCGGETCGLGQRCETDKKGEQSCVDNECGDLECEDTEECAPAPGGGNYCADNSCDADVDCPINRFCDGEICVDDACTAGEAKCDGDKVVLCSANGGEEDEAPYSCESAGYFESICDDSAPGLAGCTCEDDWDCPNFTTCEVGACVGTGKEPTCRLEPQPFEDLLPEEEFRWGGLNYANPAAVDAPFSFSGQVSTTPVVINLDDDNGDGKINEFDFPEILFMSYGTDVEAHGVVRAVHGGGANKGKDYFALCGATHWFEGDALTNDCGGATNSDNANARPAGTLAAGDIDGDGVPEIVVPLKEGDTEKFEILNNRGEIISKYDPDIRYSGEWNYPAPAIVNVDYKGFAELVIGNRILTMKKDGDGKLVVDKVFKGTGADGTMHHFGDQHHHGPTVCVADLTTDYAGFEFVAGSTAYRMPDVPANCDGANATTDYCQGELTVLWDAWKGTIGTSITYQNGFCAVADVWGEGAGAPGSDNPLDGKPEVVLISDGTLEIINAETGEVRHELALGGGTQGGAPNVDDFDGDGFPEIATALSDFYTVVDLQAPTAACPAWDDVLTDGQTAPGGNDDRSGNAGASCSKDSDCTVVGTTCNETDKTCVCLHNGWKRDTEDDSSKVTSSSVFDFNGDGAAEVVYGDECYFRLYNGLDGNVYLALPSLSRTIVENPVVADVDNDGNAEIVFVQNTDIIRCGEDDQEGSLNDYPTGTIAKKSLPNGIQVWGDPSDQWVAARRIWNQHSYHVTNVTESGSIPLHEPESWRPLNGRLYNTYRSQPRNYNVAPDLALTAIQISSPDAACGSLSDTIQIVVEVRNLGDLRVGPGVVLSYEGTWGNDTETLVDGGGDPITFTLDKSLEPGASTLVTVEYDAGDNDQDGLPDSVRVEIDGDNKERECVEDNNDIEGEVEAGAELADLRLEIDSATGCAEPKVELTVYNDGSAPAEDVLVHLYAGDPSQGGAKIGEVTIVVPIEAGESEQVEVTLDAIALDITLWGIADPMNSIIECNDANNVTKGPDLDCDSGVK